MSEVSNPFMDQDRVSFLKAKVNASTRKGLLSAWPRDDRELPIVEVEGAWVRFSTLNHRTRAEQMREIITTGKENLFDTDPLGESAQQAMYKILSSQSGFSQLKSDIAERGQREHAVITAEGILINGNRRAAALRSLFRDDNNLDARYVRCVVLPTDATPAELILLETELQVAQDFKQDYSWVNQALLIEELYTANDRSFEKVAAMMHRNAKEVREDYEKIQQVNQLVELSAGEWLHVDFEPNESAFDELAQYIRNKTENEKEAVRTVYFLGTLAGVNYRDLRHLRRGDCKELVEAELAGEPQLNSLVEIASNTPKAAATSDDDLLDDILGEDQAPNAVAQILDILARQKRDAPVEMPNGAKIELTDLKSQISRVVQKAADEASEQKKDLSAVSAPIMRMEQAIQNIQRALDTVAHARALPGWDEARLSGSILQAQNLLKELELPKS